MSRAACFDFSYTANIFDKMIIAVRAPSPARADRKGRRRRGAMGAIWFIAFLPCSIITVLAAWWLTLWLYPPETVALEGGKEHLRDEIRKMGTWSGLEKRSAMLLAAAIVLWLTDFIHHIPSPSSAWG